MLGAVFDMDGLLIDSERVFVRFFSLTGKEMGFEHIDDVCKKSIGINSQGTRKIFLNYYGKDFPYEKLRSEAALKIHEFYAENGVPIKTGAINILSFLKDSGLKIALATSTSSDKAQRNLIQTNLYKYFDEFVFGEEIKRGKPCPDIFLAAAQKLKLSPKDCYAFEDSFNGVKSASGAEMKTIMIPDLLMPTEEIKSMAYRIFSSLDEANIFLKDELKK